MEWQTRYILEYQDLAPWQKAEISNGCGAQSSTFRPPHYELYADACGPHDLDYAIGGSWLDKMKADWRLRSRLRERTKTAAIQELRNNLYMDDTGLPDFMVRQIYYRWADIYYVGVVAGGNSSFRYAKNKRWPKLSN